MSDKKDDRYWAGGEEDLPSLLLVRAPLTLGHTQLTIKRNQIEDTEGSEKKREAHNALFQRAGPEIGRAIQAMHDCLKEDLLAEFFTLAGVTRTSGKLIKVLVLRTSADEDVAKRLKIHLVPYFWSHRDSCQKRFEQQHDLGLPGVRRGGLLGWLGEQEDRVDEWEVDYPDEDKLNAWASETLGLTKLAEKLKAAREKVK